MTKLIIGIDLNTGLKLYTVPTKKLIKLKAKFPNFIFKFINTKKNTEICKNIDIYWGNRITKDIIKSCKKLKWIHFGSVGVDRARTSEISNRNMDYLQSGGKFIVPLPEVKIMDISSLHPSIQKIGRN